MENYRNLELGYFSTSLETYTMDTEPSRFIQTIFNQMVPETYTMKSNRPVVHP